MTHCKIEGILRKQHVYHTKWMCNMKLRMSTQIYVGFVKLCPNISGDQYANRFWRQKTFKNPHSQPLLCRTYIYIYIYSHELKLRMPFWKCNFEGYVRRFLELECLPTPCFPHLFLLQSDRLTTWVNISSWPKTLLPKAWKRKNAENPAYSTIFQSRIWSCSGDQLERPENMQKPWVRCISPAAGGVNPMILNTCCDTKTTFFFVDY